MKSNKIAILLVVVAVVAASVGGAKIASSQAVPAARLAFLDVAEIFQKYQKSSDIQQAVRVDIQRIDQELRKRFEELKRQQGDMDLLVPGTQEFNEKKRALDFEAFKLEYEEKEKKGQVLQAAVKKMSLVYTEIRNEAENYARRNGYHAVLMYNDQQMEARSLEELQVLIASRPVIFRDQMMDVTEAVLQILSK